MRSGYKSPARLCAAGAAVLLTAIGATPAPAQALAEDSAEWAAIVEAARQEGQVIVWGQAGAARLDFAKTAFEAAYPGIRVEFFQAGTSGERDGRYMREREAGLAEVDVLLGGAMGAAASLLPNDALQPSRDLLRADVLDPAAWQDGELRWTDSAGAYFLTADYQSYPAVTVNARIAEGEITAWEDLLDPKYDGRIIMRDPRQSGSGFAATLFLYYHPLLGPDFVDAFFKGGRIVFSSDERQNVEWIDSGRMLIGVFARSQEVDQLEAVGGTLRRIPYLTAQGQPVATVSSTDGIAFLPALDPLPHPNAARVYLNWFYSQAGQQAMVDTINTASYRADVDQSELSPWILRRPDVDYMNMNAERFASAEVVQAMRDAVTRSVGN